MILHIGVERDYSRVKVYQPLMTTNQFMDLAQLCTDHSVLASHLLSMGKSMAGAENPTEICTNSNVHLFTHTFAHYIIAQCNDIYSFSSSSSYQH